MKIIVKLKPEWSPEFKSFELKFLKSKSYISKNDRFELEPNTKEYNHILNRFWKILKKVEKKSLGKKFFT